MAKTPITQREANWMTHVAGAQAEAAATASGMAPSTADHLLDGGAGFSLGSITLPPIHAGFLMMLPRVEALKATLPSISSEPGQLAALAFLIGEPAAAWATLRHNDGGVAFESAAFEYAQQFTLRDLRKVAQWMNTQMAALNDTGDDTTPGKQ